MIRLILLIFSIIFVVPMAIAQSGEHGVCIPPTTITASQTYICGPFTLPPDAKGIYFERGAASVLGSDGYAVVETQTRDDWWIWPDTTAPTGSQFLEGATCSGQCYWGCVSTVAGMLTIEPCLSGDSIPAAFVTMPGSYRIRVFTGTGTTPTPSGTLEMTWLLVY